MEIKVLGPGCPNCLAPEINVREALAEAGVISAIGSVGCKQKLSHLLDLLLPAETNAKSLIWEQNHGSEI